MDKWAVRRDSRRLPLRALWPNRRRANPNHSHLLVSILLFDQTSGIPQLDLPQGIRQRTNYIPEQGFVTHFKDFIITILLSVLLRVFSLEDRSNLNEMKK